MTVNNKNQETYIVNKKNQETYIVKIYNDGASGATITRSVRVGGDTVESTEAFSTVKEAAKFLTDMHPREILP
jgi:hypothetical protein